MFLDFISCLWLPRLLIMIKNAEHQTYTFMRSFTLLHSFYLHITLFCFACLHSTKSTHQHHLYSNSINWPLYNHNYFLNYLNSIKILCKLTIIMTVLILCSSFWHLKRPISWKNYCHPQDRLHSWLRLLQKILHRTHHVKPPIICVIRLCISFSLQVYPSPDLQNDLTLIITSIPSESNSPIWSEISLLACMLLIFQITSMYAYLLLNWWIRFGGERGDFGEY